MDDPIGKFTHHGTLLKTDKTSDGELGPLIIHELFMNNQSTNQVANQPSNQPTYWFTHL